MAGFFGCWRLVENGWKDKAPAAAGVLNGQDLA
jgi:hypothetical protein